MTSIHRTYLLPLILLILTCTTACMEDESFTQNPTNQLEFSDDTIDFHTVYTGIGSRTEELTVFNHNDKAVRLTSIRLASGGKNGFRINVDGQYGTAFTDIEIFHNDSIFIFIEAIPQESTADTLFKTTDAILFTLPNGKTQQILLTADAQNVNIMRGVTIRKDTLFSSPRPYIIYDSLRIDSGVKAVFAPGTSLRFHKKAEMRVHGTVKALGTLGQPIVFRGDRTDNLFPTLPYDNTSATWEGIHIYPESEDNVFDFCDIHGGNYGIKVDATTRENSLTLTNSIVNNVAGSCLELIYCQTRIENCQISNAKQNCLRIIGGEVDVVHSTIAQFYPWDYSDKAIYFANYQDSTAYPLDAMNLTNCIVSGYSDDEVSGSMIKGDSVRFEYMFRNCLLQVDTTGMDSLRLQKCIFDTDTTTSKKKNFKDVPNNKNAYTSDFSLDSLSKARGIAIYLDDRYTLDLKGITRPKDNPDAGAYQSTYARKDEK